MGELIVFCNPGNAYKGKREHEVAIDYTSMAIDDYDKLVSFDKSYSDFVDAPDFTIKVGKKRQKDLILNLFALQPVIRVGDINSSFISSSYLFNPKYDNSNYITDKEIFLPDLDIIQIDNFSKTKEAASIIKEFYEEYGWLTYIFDGRINEREIIQPTSKRFDEFLEIIPPKTLMSIAKEKVNYNLDDLCF
ncbi:hypothetical protein COY26_05590 [Candidatus Woesearchaeota archaeon CG_4_10_14_0_2_um_filter_33_10]|nr:MAG: hypothetical protein AUJ83_04655 [Candidatus Woesearchaeota archaeon CG1_02_33_12]PIN79144.1 MAG: hypothetical protein COV14_00765 [Candidatus Woesearchaeota archaeon CG10_big_fil_rev_8_21_14_0_10_33_12]PIU72767.1 MAG: hypothetical protein COS79_01255 [Candidatus Woesearchaeota archaeon CG06_land_8_20_14_3_00_33_13]PIZ51810.1 MAG: hypothetical protein COY26_05590 [Candidatus Woesearchaeota archaeon CG_4_10_14_0_2_um_filter_33_10]